MIAWRQKHQQAKKDLEKRRAAWEVERARRMRIAAERQREDEQAARACKRARHALDVVIAKQDCKLEKICSKNAIRCVQPPSQFQFIQFFFSSFFLFPSFCLLATTSCED
jgi:hypothetical protein